MLPHSSCLYYQFIQSNYFAACFLKLKKKKKTSKIALLDESKRSEKNTKKKVNQQKIKMKLKIEKNKINNEKVHEFFSGR